MGYYSELAIDNSFREDHSYPSPIMQLKWRIEDLYVRLDDISKGKYGVVTHYYMDCRYSNNDLAYAPPEYFSRESDIIAAIAIAEEKLAIIEAEEAIIRENETIERNKTINEEIPGQLAGWDILKTEEIAQYELQLRQAA